MMNQNLSDFSLYWLVCLAPNNFNHVHIHHGSHVSLISSSTTCGLPMHFPNLCWWFNCLYISKYSFSYRCHDSWDPIRLFVLCFFIIEIKQVLLLKLCPRLLMYPTMFLSSLIRVLVKSRETDGNTQ